MGDLGDVVSGVINTGLRSLTTLVANGGESTRKLASDVGASALPSILNTRKSIQNIRNSGGILLNDGRIVFPNRVDLGTLTTRVILDVAPAIRDFNKALEEQNGLFGGQPSGSRPLGGGLLLKALGFGNNGGASSSSAEPSKIDVSKIPEPSFDDIPENVF